MPQYGTKAVVETPHHGDDGELDLEEDDVVNVLLKRDSDWWIGKTQRKERSIPSKQCERDKRYTVIHMLLIFCYQIIEYFLNTCQSDS